jgi:hypothetical protein
LSGIPLASAGEAAGILEKPKMVADAKTEITSKTTASSKQRCSEGDYSWLTQSCRFDACAYLAKHPTLADIISLNFSGEPRDIDMAAASLGIFNQVTVSQKAGAYGIITTQ